MIHAPSVFDFRKETIFYGPISDLIPSTPVFEMYPFGFVTISTHLHNAGYKTRIVNLATLMLEDENFDVGRFVRKLSSKVFGIDLHWLPHAQGSLAIADLIKKYHPDARIVFGGFSSTYYHRELISYPQVDMVMRGDSTEVPMVSLMDALEKGDDLSKIPNLLWKENGKVIENPLNFVPNDLDYLDVDYGWVIRSVIRHLDLNGFKPFRDWDRYPLTAVFSARGCTMNCAICGGSCSAMRSVFCRKRPAYRSPELLALDVYNIYCHLKSPIFIVGDLRQGGKDYPERFFNEVKKLGVENHIVLEIFTPAQNEFFSMASKSLGSYSVQFSPDSQDEKVRYALGRCFDNASLESTVLKSFKHGCKRFDLFFMIGLPQQTLASVFAIADYIDHFYRTIESAEKEKLFFYASPLAPFLDPGSQAFENPEVYGYRLFARTLEDHRVRLLNPSWKDVLSYETIWMTRSEIVRSSYDVAERINARRFESGLISREAYESLVDRITLARKLDAKIESIMLIRDMQERRNQLQSLRDEVRALMESTICKKRDLEWEAEGILRSVPRALFGILKGKKMR